MKKVLALALALVMLVSLAACGAKTLTPYEGDASTIITSIYKDVSFGFMVGEAAPVDLNDAWAVQSYLGLGTPEEEIPAADENTPVADEAVTEETTEETTAAATTDLGIAEAYYSESMMGQAYSLVVARVADADYEKVEAVKKAMFEGINTRKWICVEADQLRVVSCEDIVMLVMISSDLGGATADEVVDAFAKAMSSEQVTDGDVRAALTGEILARG